LRVDAASEIGDRLGSFEKVEELLANHVGEGLVRAEIVFDSSGGITLLDPNLAWFH